MTIKRLIALFLFLALALALGACGGGAKSIPTPDLSQNNLPEVNWAEDFNAEIEWGECPFEGYGIAPQCGNLSVPRDYDDPKGDKLKIAFAVYKSSGEGKQEDPIVLSIGMPLTAESGFLPFLFEDLFKQRDLVIFDPRGMGLTEPSLLCNQFVDQFYDSLAKGGFSPEDMGRLHQECRTSIETAGTDLNAYSLSNSANDIKALRLALEYPRWNLVAVEPYGAAMAYEQLRIDSQGVRSLLLDGTLPGFNSDVPDYAAAQAILSEFFGLCTSDEKCAATFPNLEDVFYQVVDQLNSEAMTVTAYDTNAGRRLEIQVNGDLLVEMVLNSISGGQNETIGQIPRAIYQVKDGVDETLAKMAGEYFQNVSSPYEGLIALAACRQAPPPDINDVAVALSTLPEGLASYFKQQDLANREVCASWEPIPAEALQIGAGSNPPVLLINGSWNWTWAPQGEVAAFQKEMSDAQVVTIPMASQFNLFTRGAADCTRQMLSDFIESPDADVDDTCLPQSLNIVWITMR